MAVEITTRSLWTLIHGMGFGALYLLACSGALVELYRLSASPAPTEAHPTRQLFLNAYLFCMVALAWAAVLTGAYIIYPWYRAVPPRDASTLTAFPQRLLMSSPATYGWHSIGMEWKEHVAWFAPISITAAAAVAYLYGPRLSRFPRMRAAVLAFTAASFLAAGIAGFFGAMIDKSAPVQGGRSIQLYVESGK
jgi:hypothetical protein